MSVHTHIFKSRKNGYVALSLLQLLQKFRYTIIFSISLYFTPLAGRSLSTEHARRHHQPGRVKQADPCRWLPGQRAHQSARRFAERQRPQTATGLGGNADLTLKKLLIGNKLWGRIIQYGRVCQNYEHLPGPTNTKQTKFVMANMYC